VRLALIWDFARISEEFRSEGIQIERAIRLKNEDQPILLMISQGETGLDRDIARAKSEQTKVAVHSSSIRLG
jgi:hypothetical protein